MDSVSTNVTNTIPKNITNTIPTNVTSTMSINSDYKKVRCKEDCYILHTFAKPAIIFIIFRDSLMF